DLAPPDQATATADNLLQHSEPPSDTPPIAGHLADPTVPLSPLNETTSTADTHFESPLTSSSSFNLSQYYDELRQMAHELEHEKDAIQFDIQEEASGSSSSSSSSSSYELLFCPSQPFLARLSVHGQMFEP